MDISQLQALSLPEAIRFRPAVYIGSTQLFGFIQYLVCPVALCLASGARQIAVSVDEKFTLATDVAFLIEQTPEGIAPFQVARSIGPGQNLEGAVLCALSQELLVSATTHGQTETLHFAKGQFISSHIQETPDAVAGTVLRFKPDLTIFTVSDLSATIFESYFRRLSFLHPGVRFSFSAGGQTQEYCAEQGILDLFNTISPPYQLMHEPIHFTAQEGNLSLELAMAFQSWTSHHLWCFINRGRAVEGGTHEQGLTLALRRLQKQLSVRNSVVAVVSIIYPEAVWEGCIKSRIGNPELKSKVSRLVVKETLAWLDAHPTVATQISQLEYFQFPEVWST